MANRVNININVRDLTRQGLASVRRGVQRLQASAGQAITARYNLAMNRARTAMRNFRSAAGRRINSTFSTSFARARAGLRAYLANATRPVTAPYTLTFNRARAALARFRTAARRPIRTTVNLRTRGLNTLSRGLRGAVMGPLRALGGLASGIMQDGIGQGIIQGFRAGGPVGMAALAAIIVASLSVIGAALSGLLIVALGAAFVAVGGIAAAQSEQIKAKWKTVLGSLKKDFEEVGKPMIPVLDHALSKLQKMGHEAAPALKRALEETAPATQKFIDSLMEGFRSFGKNAFDRIMEAWNVFAPVFGEQWDEFMGELGDSFGDMADLVKKHPTEIAAALEVVFEVLELIVDTVTFLGGIWVFMYKSMLDSIGFATTAFATFVGALLDGMSSIVHGASVAFGWIPGLGGKLRDADRAFGEWKEGVKSKLDGVAERARAMSSDLDKANRTRRLKADISELEAKLRRARSDLQKTSDKKAKAKVKADIAQLEAALRKARGQLNALNGKTVSTYTYNHVVTVFSQQGSSRTVPRGGQSQHEQRAHGGVMGASKFAHGGIGRANRLTGLRGNLTLVGEQGPEMVRLPFGSSVRTAGDTRRIMGQGGGGVPTGVAKIVAGSGDLDRLLLQILRKAIRNEGGDVQVVLGGRGR